MKIQPTICSNQNDLIDMLILSQAFPQINLRVTDLPYRLCSWALDDPENTHLWRDEQGRLRAWAVLQSPWWTIDYAVLPEDEARLHPEILDWANRRAMQAAGTPYGRPSWYVCAFSDQAGRIHDLEAAGFASQADMGEDSWSKVFMRRPGEIPVQTYRIPEGFSVRPLAGESEVEAYVELQRTVFGSKNMTAEWRLRTLRHPDYRPELDLVVESPDGRLVAFCVCWINTRSEGIPLGQVEPLGCHPDFTRYALGRLVLAEGLRRLQSCGAEEVYVETDNYRDTAFALYEAMGFEVIRDVWMFRKDYGN